MTLELVAQFRRTSGVPAGRGRRLAISIVQRCMPYRTECVLHCHWTVQAQRRVSNDSVPTAHDYTRDAQTAFCRRFVAAGGTAPAG